MEELVFDHVERADPLAKSVIQRITEAIVTGHLVSGEKLVETKLAENLGVSRGPVREALRRLEEIGLVEKFPYRGAFVSALTRQDVEELHNVREPLEGLGARLLAEQQDAEAIARLKSILTQMGEADIASDRSRMIDLDTAFHDNLIRLTEHKLLCEVWQIVRLRLHRFLYLKRQRLYRSPEEAVAIHKPIVDAIANGHPEQAEQEARKHVITARRNLDIASLEMVMSDSNEIGD